ncbi:MAG: Gfo/Idh/MocA family oxidoreductase [Deltaproteobacteria bacterium]|nr:Gfo/Idh/MocA family oxidoreductase [Deltaproteobacteria bacterium]MBM4322525.1 Gfo/Idh/MocA family oxidoreductase [Deltaproteobacteria bacterium]
MLNIAQIGVGYWGPNLLRNLVANRRCKVKAAVDLSEERRRYVQDLYPAIRVTDDVNEVFQDEEIGAVVIATPVATHYSLALRALEAEKHILVEKPLARSVAEVEQIGKVAREKDLLAMVGHTFLFNAAVRYVKELIDTGKLGQIRYIYSQRLNLGRIRSDVDALWNFAPHDISIIQYWLGDPRPLSVMRSGMAYIQKDIEDVVFMNIIYPNNIMANIHVSWLDPQRARSMTIVGSQKMVVYDDTAENKIAIYDKGIDQMAVLGQNMDYDNQNFQTFNQRSGDVVLPKIDFKEPLRVEIEHFIDCIEKGTKCLTGVDHAQKVVEILAAGNGQIPLAKDIKK